MLQIKVPVVPEQYDEVNNLFIDPVYQVLKLEHSLVSISKWESKWHKSFLHTADKTDEEVLDYIKCMTLSQNIDPDVYNHLTIDNLRDINKYINDPMTATILPDDKSGKRNREIVTSELIYYWMIAYNIPVEFQKWHIERLMTLVRICSIKNEPPKKRSRSDIMKRNAALNEARRKQLNSKG